MKNRSAPILVKTLDRLWCRSIHKAVFAKSKLPNYRYIHLFLTNHGPFQQHLNNINKRDSPLCICGSPSTSLHYILDCTLTAHYHIRKHSQMSLSDCWNYVEKRPVLLRKTVDCVRFVEINEHFFVNPLPFAGDGT